MKISLYANSRLCQLIPGMQNRGIGNTSPTNSLQDHVTLLEAEMK